MIEAETCPVDSNTINIMLRETRYFQTLTKKNGNIMILLEAMLILWALEVPHSPYGYSNLCEG